MVILRQHWLIKSMVGYKPFIVCFLFFFIILFMNRIFLGRCRLEIQDLWVLLVLKETCRTLSPKRYPLRLAIAIAASS